ncbi:MAG: hypothetical protein ABIZ92_17375 [Vicinamibacterales bacterium]
MREARMVRIAAGVVLCSLLMVTSAAAQERAASLATLFEDIFGPHGLVVASQDVQIDGTNHAAHFNSAFQSDFRLVNIALTSQLAAIPLPSPASGFTYRFDPSTGTFQRSTRSFGPILADRGETIGKGKIAFGFSYQFFSFDHLDGVPLVSIPAVFTHDNFQAGGGRSDVVATTNSIEATFSQFSGALTYGISDRFDISVAVPIVRTRLSLLSNATIHRVGTGGNVQVHYFPDPSAIGGFGSARQFFAEGSAGGVGDIVVRGKTTVLREGPRALAVGADLRLPTGDEGNLLGSGATGIRPFAAFSTSLGRFAPHANVGYQWNGESVIAGDVASGIKADLPDHFLYALGGDFSVNERLSVVADLGGQRVINSPRLSTRTTTASGPGGTVTLPDLQFETSSYWVSSGAVGLKANVARSVLIAFNLRFNIGNNGLTDRIAPLLGFEWAF